MMPKLLLFLLLLLMSLFDGLFRIARINEHAAEAAQAFERDDYKTAIIHYRYLTDSLQVEDDQVKLNLAHAYFKTGERAFAQKWYSQLTTHPQPLIRTVSQLQLGILAAQAQQYEEALNRFREALITDPDNQEAAYNYELVKKYLQQHPEALRQPNQQPEQEQQPENEQKKQEQEEEQQEKPQTKPDEQGEQEEETEKQEQQPSGGQEQPQKQNNRSQQEQPGQQPGNNGQEQKQQQGDEAGDTKGMGEDENPAEPNKQNRGGNEAASPQDRRFQTQRERLQRMNISQEKAQMLLDAMRTQEQQYLQQIPKKATKPVDRSKPDW